MHVTNKDFLTAIFGTDAPWAHITDFPYPPDDIPKDCHLSAWKGDYASRYTLSPDTNQYFTLSTFYADEDGHARRRKALYRQTHCIVLDDVHEKLSIDEVNKLPSPSWVLETSTGSEQWGYILSAPCADRARVENLLDGLVLNGLAPDGRDPGMKGVTRYVRLPEGINNKKSKGLFKCQMKRWQPFTRVTLEQLAAPFRVDLDAPRREARTDGAAAVADHPLLQSGLLNIKEIRSDGRFDITCPWVHEHTGADDSGAAIFTNADGSFGFKCHHGSCQERTGGDLMRWLEDRQLGFKAHMSQWQFTREMASTQVSAAPCASQVPDAPTAATTALVTPEQLIDDLRRLRPNSTEAKATATNLLKLVDGYPKIDQKDWHDQVRDLMHWNVQDFKRILDDLRKQWYGEQARELGFYSSLIFVRELNQFYDYRTRIFYSAEAMQNSYSDQDAEVRKQALQEGRVQKVDRLDYAPRQPRIFEDRGVSFGNTWCEASMVQGEAGDCEAWLSHWGVLDWEDHRDHMLDWMAYTVQRPEHKINHALLLGSGEGCGKDFLLYPLIKAMGDNAQVIGGEELLEGFNEYLMSTKYLHINEVEIGDHREAKTVSQRLKPMTSAPPELLSVNKKGVSRVKVRNIVNCTMTTNSALPLKLNGASRRFYALWSDFNPRDARDNMLPHWLAYWQEKWDWMKADGWKHCVAYLRTRDISHFNPFAAPPMTEFVREIKEQSKSPMLQTIETFIRKQHGIFKCDLLTAADMEDVLKAGALFGTDMLVDGKHFTARHIGRCLRESGSYRQIKTNKARIWILRNHELYAALPTSAIYDRYHTDINRARRDGGLNVVK